MIIAALVGIMIATVVGISLIPTITDTVNQAETTAAAAGEPVSSSVSGLLGVLPFIFVAVIILGAVAWMGFGADGEGKGFSLGMPKFLKRKEKVPAMATVAVQKNSRELVARIEQASQKWGEYFNNLDQLLGIITIGSFGLVKDDCGLVLMESNKLMIHPHYDWYITDKHPEQDMFKVVGLHKQDASKNLVCLLGKNEQTQQPYLVKVHSSRLEDSITECIDHGVSSADEALMGLKQPERELVGVRAMKVNVPTLTYAETDAQPTGIYVKSDGHLGNWMT